MRYLTFLFLMVFSILNLTAQDRRQALIALKSLKERLKSLEAKILQPDESDILDASKENAEVFRILPRGKNDNNLSDVRGGGAYYSFSTKSHSYDKTPQIQLEEDVLSVGFAGADYGAVADLGELLLSQIITETRGADFLAAYRPPNEEAKARIEFRRLNGFEENGVIYKRGAPAVVNHTYVLRAVSYDQADILVAFKVYRKDFDGSLIVFWKKLLDFEKPSSSPKRITGLKLTDI